MAQRIEFRFTLHLVADETPTKVAPTASAIEAVPAVFWSSGDLWTEASTYLAHRASIKTADGDSIAAVQAESWHLRAYASFLEDRKLSWQEFPIDPALRPTRLFRGHLLRARSSREISPSTASTRISAVKRFYSWVLEMGLLESDAIPYTTRNINVRYQDRVGLAQTARVTTTDLAIPNRSARSEGVEDGLFPLTGSQRDSLVNLASDAVHLEMQLMLKLGLFSGMRIGTIVGLTLSALDNAFQSHDISGWVSLEVGPRVGIPTKGNVQYFPSMPPWLFAELRAYSRSIRALERRAKTDTFQKDLLFLKFNGGAYTNVTNRDEMAKLKRDIAKVDLGITNFKFHCTRATFGTSIVLAYMEHSTLTTSQILKKLMCLMGHRSIQSSLRYIKFIEEAEQDKYVNEQYASIVLGLSPNSP